MSTITYLTAITAAITVFVIYLRHRFTYWSRHGVSGPNFIEWKQLFTVDHEYTAKQVKKYGTIYGTYDLFRKSIVITQPDLIRDIMVKDFYTFPDHKHYYTGSSKVNLGLFFLPGNHDWKRIRSIVSPAFTSTNLRSMMACISDISDKFGLNLQKYADKCETVDLRQYIGAFTLDVISECSYGIKTDSITNPNHPLVVNVKRILQLDANFSGILSVIAQPIAKFLKVELFDLKSVNYLDVLTKKIVEDRKKLIDCNKKSNPIGNKRSDFIQLMIDSEKCDDDLGKDSQKSSRTLTSDELTAQGIIFFVGGSDTTTAAISHSLYYLSKHKDCQQRLYEELQTINQLSYESLKELKYLNAVINETLRLAPSLIRLQRECVKDYKLRNTNITIPAGTLVEIFPYALHRDPQFFAEPDIFKPERFISDLGQQKIHPYAYIPFGGGPRVCIGMRFGLYMMRMCIAKLVKKFEFELTPNFTIEYFKGNALISPKHLMVDIKARI